MTARQIESVRVELLEFVELLDVDEAQKQRWRHGLGPAFAERMATDATSTALAIGLMKRLGLADR